MNIPDVWQIQHVGLSVASIDRSLAIYRDILGMEVALDMELPPDHVKAHFQDVFSLEHKKLRVAVVKSATGIWLELFQFSEPDPQPVPADAKFSRIGICQIALEVKDINEVVKKLEAAGITFIHPLFKTEMPTGFKCKFRSFRDPDGILIELVEARGADTLTQRPWQ